MKLKRKLRGVNARVELAKGLRVACFVLDRIEPRARELGYQVADLSRPAVKLDGAGHEKATASKDAAANVVEPRVEHRKKPDQPALTFKRRVDDFADENVAGLFDDGKLKLFLGAEVRKQAALAHIQLVGEAPDGQAYEPFGRGDMHGRLKNLVPGPGAPGFFVSLLSDVAYCFHKSPFALVRSCVFYYTNDRAVNRGVSDRHGLLEQWSLRMTAVNIAVNKLQPADWETVLAIYLEGIATGNATFETEALDWETWDRSHLIFARLVARDNLKILGWAALSPVSNRRVYAGVAEVSVYAAASARGLGVGRSLLTSLIEEADQNGIWTLQAGIFPENTASIALHRRCGFREVGRRERLGMLCGVWRDIILLERRSRAIE